MGKLTKAQRAFLTRHLPSGELGRWQSHGTYDFVGRVRDLGLIKIVDGERMGWPYSWEKTVLTEEGLAAVSPSPPPREAGR